MSDVPRHKVFISFHHKDQCYKDDLMGILEDHIVDKSVEDGDIDDNLQTDTIRQKIRDEFIRDASVTIVLVGPCTWQRKHVDWEIGSSLRRTRLNSRCGLLGILLPNHGNYERRTRNPRLIPPRLVNNCNGDDPFAQIYDWPRTWRAHNIKKWIHTAFKRRNGTSPDNSRPQFRRNRGGRCADGWSD